MVVDVLCAGKGFWVLLSAGVKVSFSAATPADSDGTFGITGGGSVRRSLLGEGATKSSRGD